MLSLGLNSLRSLGVLRGSAAVAASELTTSTAARHLLLLNGRCWRALQAAGLHVWLEGTAGTAAARCQGRVTRACGRKRSASKSTCLMIRMCRRAPVPATTLLLKCPEHESPRACVQWNIMYINIQNVSGLLNCLHVLASTKAKFRLWLVPGRGYVLHVRLLVQWIWYCMV